MVRVALAGLGFMGKTHLGVLLGLPNIKLTALMDLNEASLDLKSLDAGGNIASSGGEVDLSGVRKYTDFDALLADGGFDYVDLCLPTSVHAEYTIKALEKGYHVFCEKPMALTAEEADAMVAAEKSSGKMLSVGQCLRFWPAYIEVKKLIDSGTYGKVTFAELGRYSSRPGWGWKSWLLDSKLSGNAALDLHVHDVDMILWLFGKPTSVRSSGIVEADGGISQISTVYGYDGKVITSTGGWNCSDSFGFNMRAFIVLERATIELDFSKEPTVLLCPQGEEKRAVKLAEGDGYLHEIKDFVAGIEAGKASGVVTGESAAESVKLALLEIQSAKEKREFEVSL